MQLPTVDRSALTPPTGAAAAMPAAARVIPVAPVNPPSEQALGAGVVNDINPELQVKAAAQAARMEPGEDPTRAEGKEQDWAERFKAGRPEEPPKEPISKMLMEHIQTLWSASARAVELWLMNNAQHSQDPNKVQLLAETRKQDPAALPGVVAREVLTYEPSKIRKTEKTE